jgi:hypothetical protein
MTNKLNIGLIGLCGFFWLSTAVAFTQAPQQWRFKVFLDEQEIGYHTVTVNPEKTRATVQIEANFDVKFLFFTAYRYRHNNRETWENDCLRTIDSHTNDNGDTFYVTGQSQEHLLALDTPNGSQSLQGCVRTFAYWDPRLLQASRLLNAQTGEYLDVVTDFIANEKLIINGDSIDAKHYRLRAENIEIDLWYSQNMHWLALQTTTEGGNQLRYQLEQFPV